ncbi:MAG: 2-oxoglutarate dehydrogenase E1 component, partial [Deltaproteobacteria bacterium]|nr:2-oxoglutarate dehydrogenase E1 component [Deltaproteobacteria bacterium]
HGPNAGYILDLYSKYFKDPSSVDPKTKALFDRWNPEIDGEISPRAAKIDKIVGAVNLAQDIRAYGHLAARIDPLGTDPPGDPSLDISAHGLTEEDLTELPPSLIGGPIAQEAANALDAIESLLKIYTSHRGFDYDHIHIPEEREWLRLTAESGRFRPPKDPIAPHALLETLTKVEVFERFLHRIFPGKFRFSIEGMDMLVPMLNEIIAEAAEAGITNILLGMAHRGRLNVMAHVLNKPYVQTFVKFRDPVLARDFKDDMGWTGDVKYHEGASRAVKNGRLIEMVVTLSPNPSHLESVNPVVEGMARSAGTKADKPGSPEFDHTVTLPILIHGDAGFPGEGIVAETLNLSRLPGYRTGGTIHLITNNQLGFTTNPEAGRSTLYASDLAKGFEIPIVHVNADDPEACIEAARLAFAYLIRFHKDFLIDLVGYRRHGHNEADEPSFTHPSMYRTIEKLPTVRELWANTLNERKIINEKWPEELITNHMEQLHRDLESLGGKEVPLRTHPEPPPPGIARKVKTSVPAQKLKIYFSELHRVPVGFNLHPKLKRAMERRSKALDNDHSKPTVDWAMAEQLAFASILADGIAIRFTGQDTERGTFSHRHAVFHDINTDAPYIPLQALPQARAAFEIHNSPLSENAALGFEYGYNIQEPQRLVIWEAQYGDFINGAQVIIDEFLTSARAKWGQTPSLVLLLPHAYEGQGPDHSSARVERFLESAADINIRVANCTTAAQYFHLLRRQAALLRIDPLPLVILTPKSLLRNPAVTSSLLELSEGSWQPVIDDPSFNKNIDQVRRLIFCSGKVYIDLVTSDFRNRNTSVAIVRVEQYYPLPTNEIKRILDEYNKINEVVWL